MLEAEVAGFGASGRNGGWCSALFPASLDKLAARSPGLVPRRGARPARRDARHGRRGRPGARRRGHRRPLGQGRHDRARPHTAPSSPGPAPRSTHARRWGCGEDDVRLLAGQEARVAAGGHGASAGRRTRRDCARVHPAGWSRGLAEAVERRGVTHLRAAPPSTGDRAAAGSAPTHGTVRADVVVRATEGYTRSLRGPPPRAGRRSTR